MSIYFFEEHNGFLPEPNQILTPELHMRKQKLMMFHLTICNGFGGRWRTVLSW